MFATNEAQSRPAARGVSWHLRLQVHVGRTMIPVDGLVVRAGAERDGLL